MYRKTQKLKQSGSLNKMQLANFLKMAVCVLEWGGGGKEGGEKREEKRILFVQIRSYESRHVESNTLCEILLYSIP